MVIVDLFSGAGGLTEGFFQEGFNIIAHIEKEPWACETLKTRICYHFLKEQNNLDLYFTYLKNSKNYRTISQNRQIIFDQYPELQEKLNMEVLNKSFGNPANDPKATSTTDIIRLIESSMHYNNKTGVDLIIGGPPCQAYSLIGRARMKESVYKDKRNYLFYYYKELVNYFRPRMFVFENVPGILTAHNGKIFTTISKEFDSIGYTLLSGINSDHKANIINSKSFGVYQSRKRVILFGFRKDLDLYYPDFQKYAFCFDEPHTTKNAIGDLPFVYNGEGSDSIILPYSDAGLHLSKYQQFMRKDCIGVINHKARPNLDQDKQIYRIAIEKAQCNQQLRYSELPEHLKTHKSEYHFEDRFKVHWWDDLPHTIVAHIAKDGHYNIHPDLNQCRSLTVREAARIQSFPDNYKFEGPRTAQFVQVGNAVPPLMAQTIAKAIKNEFF